MTRIATLPLALMLLTTALAGCLDGAEPTDTSELDENTSQNSADIATLNEDIEAISDILDADLLLIEALEANLSAVADDLNAAVTNISTVAADLNAVETQLAALDARVTILETAVTNINQMLDQHTAQIEILEADHAADIAELEAELESVTSCRLEPYGNCKDADLGGEDLSGKDLMWIDLRNADLSGADLSYAHLEYADLTGA